MSSELLWAVTDGSTGTNAVALPEDRSGARRLELHYGGTFWCSREAGGCGGRLVLHAGDEVRPYFRHHGGARCPLIGREADAGRAYEHLRYQRALTAWLTGQGYRPRLEKVRGQDGGTDLHLVVDEIGHAIEVQLSPLSDVAWRERDDRYHAHVRHVTWLYGPAAEAAGATEAAVRGVSLALRRHSVGLAVGVRDVEHRTRWIRLGACRLTADGFSAPGVEEARALHARRAADRQEAARRAARQAARRTQPGQGATRRGQVGPGEDPVVRDAAPAAVPGMRSSARPRRHRSNGLQGARTAGHGERHRHRRVTGRRSPGAGRSGCCRRRPADR